LKFVNFRLNFPTGVGRRQFWQDKPTLTIIRNTTVGKFMKKSFKAAQVMTALALLASVGFTGCVSMDGSASMAKPPVLDSAELGGAEDDPSQPPAIAPAGTPSVQQVNYQQPAHRRQAVYKVTVFGVNGPKAQVIPLEGIVLLQEALDRSKASRWFGAMTVTLVRTPPGGGERHRIDIECTKTVDEKQNYALRPGDHVIVRSSIMKKDMVSEVTDIFMGR